MHTYLTALSALLAAAGILLVIAPPIVVWRRSRDFGSGDPLPSWVGNAGIAMIVVSITLSFLISSATS